MIPKSGYRFSDKIMLQRSSLAIFRSEVAGARPWQPTVIRRA
jgi:hypothetical protein